MGDCPKPHFRRISPALLERLWMDKSVPCRVIAKQVGLSEKGLTRRAKAMGLPLRGFCTKKLAIGDGAGFAALWRAGISLDEIARYFGVTNRTVSNTRARLGLMPRVSGTRPAMTLDEYRDTLLARAMGHDARGEQAQMILAEMADRVDNRMVGAAKVRAA